MTDSSAFDATELSLPRPSAGAGTPLLSVRDLAVSFPTDAGIVQAVDGVSFDIYPGETLALVGESGSGKSVTAMSILRLIESQRGRVQSGQVYFEGRDLLALSPAEVRSVRGNRIGMVFQEPMSSLNPVYRWWCTAECPAPEQRVDEYPHQLSGGMRQRAMIAMALACRPSLLIADEPTTALDVTVQAQILELIAQLQAELKMSVLMITHDLGVVATVAHRAIVMYAGRVVEQADVLGLFDDPRHPYTAGLFDSLPRVEIGRGQSPRLRPIEGSVPDALHFPSGCRFHPRCRFAFEPCAASAPELLAPPELRPGTGRLSACWYTAQRPGRSYLADASATGSPATDSPATDAERPGSAS
jgi:peptide/nickel transport system ATP-binding protein